MSTQWSPPDPSSSQPPPYETPGVATAGEPAGFWRRLVAFIIDGVVVGIVAGIINAIIGLIAHSVGGNYSVSGAVQFILGLIYFTYMWSAQGRTLGYMVMGMRLVRSDGTPVGVGGALARYVLIELSFLLCAIPAIVSAFMIGLSEEKKAIHDRIVGTAVISA